jgi:excisionase family DNA binding protein
MPEMLMKTAMTTSDSPQPVNPPQPRFLTVGATARLLGMSEATLYRAIRACEFPAVKVRNRYVVPRRVLDAMEDAAMRAMTMVDAADWVERGDVA